MAVDTPTKKYDFLVKIWEKIRIASTGQEAVKASGNSKTYLPCPQGYDETWYNGVLHRAYWFGATGATVEAYQGAIFRKSPILTPEVPNAQEEFFESIDDNGNDLETFSTIVTNDVIKTSYGGILVDFDDTGEDGTLTKAQVKDLGKRAKMIFYPAESIFYAEKNQVRLWETYTESTDEFTHEIKKQIKVLDLLEAIDSGKKFSEYRQRIYRQKEDESAWTQFGDDIYPKLPGSQPFDFIPFQ
ncbi:unnamed protein product, partial [marine sediment metagenome]